jgi:hypothetical protein
MNEFRRAIFWVWLIVAAAGGATAASPFIVPARVLHNVLPACQARQQNSSCPACGLTTGFVAISAGRWHDAERANAAAVPLFVIFAANSAAALAYTIRKRMFGGVPCR